MSRGRSRRLLTRPRLALLAALTVCLPVAAVAAAPAIATHAASVVRATNLPPCAGYNGTSITDTCVLPSTADGATFAGAPANPVVSPSSCPKWLPTPTSAGQPTVWCSEPFTLTLAGAPTAGKYYSSVGGLFGLGSLMPESSPPRGVRWLNCVSGQDPPCSGPASTGPVFLELTRAQLNAAGGFDELVLLSGIGLPGSNTPQHPLELPIQPRRVDTDLITIGGTVSGFSCTDTSCAKSGLAGQEILVTGKATNGSAVSETATSAADGSWSVQVPAGTYTGGPTFDGRKIDGRGFEPQKIHGAIRGTIGGPKRQNLDFAACVRTSKNGRRIPPGARTAAGGGASSPTPCKSYYAVNLSASIPQPVIVDPADTARYNVASNPGSAGYNHNAGLAAFVHTGNLRHFIGLAPEFPTCLSKVEVEAYTAHHVTADWYSYIKGGVPLGGARSTVVWNQTTQQVHLSEAPVLTFKKLTRVFRFRLTEANGHVTTSSCDETATVPVLSFAIGGADGSAATLADNQFTIITMWGVPFDPPGARVDPSGAIIDACPLCKEIYEQYDKIPEYGRFPIELIAGFVLGSAEVKAIAAGPGAVLRFVRAGAKLFPKVLKGLEWAAEGTHALHLLKSASEAGGFASGLFGDRYGGYPVMSAVVRGSFHTTDANHTIDGNPIPWKTTLALSVASTRFPNIALTVNRTYLNAKNKPIVERLPWQTAAFGTPIVYNPFSANPTSLIADSTKTGNNYASGTAAVTNVHRDTAQTPAVTEEIRGTPVAGTLAPNAVRFDAAQAEAADPSCTDTGTPSNPATRHSTLCWVFEGGRP